MKPGVDLVVVSYRTPGDLRRLLESVPTQTRGVPVSLTVVNVAPLQADREAAKRGVDALLAGWHVDGAEIVEHEWNAGYNRACNHAGGRGDRDVVVLCNADVEFVASPVLATMHANLIANPEWGVVGPRQVNRKGLFTAAGIFGSLTAPKFRSWKKKDVGQHCDTRTDAVTVSGSLFGLRRDTWDELVDCPLYRAVAPDAEGPLLPAEHFYGDEYLCRHAAGHGYANAFLGEVWARHELHGADPKCSHGAKHRDADRTLYRSALARHGLVAN